MKRLPDGLTLYKRTPTFSPETVPAALQRDHSTKPCVWGLIHVAHGALIYRIAETGEEHRLVPGQPGVIEPEALHSVDLIGDTEFFVEFWR